MTDIDFIATRRPTSSYRVRSDGHLDVTDQRDTRRSLTDLWDSSKSPVSRRNPVYQTLNDLISAKAILLLGLFEKYSQTH